MVMLLIISNAFVYAQFSPNISFMRSVPQSFVTNPAAEVPFRFWIGIPGLSSFGQSFDNTGFRYKDVFYKTPDDSLHFDVNNFLNTLDKNNFINVDTKEEILGFGFNVRSYYFDVRFTERFSNSIEYSRDLMSFLFKLNNQFVGKTADFSGTGINMTLYHELSLGVRRKLSEKWSGGFRIKGLAGVANVYSRKTDLSLFTDPDNAYAMTVHSDLEIHTSIPGLSSDPTDSLSFVFTDKNLQNELMGLDNQGLALDLGIQFQPNNLFLFGASVVDLGFINWKNNPKSYVSDQGDHDYTFDGIDINDFIGNDTASLGDQLQKVLDSLTKNLGLRTNYDAYTSYLLTRVNVTGQFNPTKKDHFGLLLQTTIFNNKIKPALTLHYNHEFGKTLNLMTGYTISKGNYLNLALGFSLKLGAIQWYVVSDNAYAFFMPTDFRYTNIQFGFNLVFGDKRDFKKVPKDVENVPGMRTN